MKNNHPNIIDLIRELPAPEECLYKITDYEIRGKYLCDYILEEAKKRQIYGDSFPYLGLDREQQPTSYKIVSNCGIRVRANYFLVANNHPVLEDIYKDSPWENGLWHLSLEQIEGAKKHVPLLFCTPESDKQTRQRCVSVPLRHIVFPQF